MKVVISNDIQVVDFSSELYDWCMNNLVVTNPLYNQLIRMGKEDSIRRMHVPKELKLFTKNAYSLNIPFGCLYSIWGMIKNSQITTQFNDIKELSNKFTKCPLELYDYQKNAVDNMVSAKGGVLVSGCGSGKTIMMIEVIHKIGEKFLWITHTGDLLRQALKDFKDLYPNMDIGLITDGKVDIGKDGAIATIQTLDKIDRRLYEKEFNVVVVDECAHCVSSPTLSKMFGRVVNNISARYKYGCTATASRSDTMIKSMYTILGTNRNGEFDPTYEISRASLKVMEAEHLKFDIDLPMNYSMLNADGTFNYNALIEDLSNNEERNKIIVDNISKCLNEGRKQVVLCHRIEHCQALYEMLKEKNYRVELVIGKIKGSKREEILNNPNDWDIIVATYSLLKEGVSVKELDTLHLVTPQKDKALVTQCVGRIERYLEGKKQPIAYDYVDINIPYCLGAYKKRKSIIKNRV